MKPPLLGSRFRALVGIETVGVLMYAELVKRREVFVADMAAIVHLILVGLGVLEETIEVRERHAARTHDTLVHLKDEEYPIFDNITYDTCSNYRGP